MKRFVCTFLLIIALGYMGVYSWFFSIKPEVEGSAVCQTSGADPITVTVPLGGTQYADVVVDGMNIELLESNQLTIWKFNDASVYRTMDHSQGKSLGNDTYLTTAKEVFRKYGNYYVGVQSDNGYTLDSKDGFLVNNAYIAPCPEMNEENQLKELPEVELPVEYETSGTWKLPSDVMEVVLSSSADDMSYYKEGWYFNYNFRYQKHGDAVVDAATRVCALSHEPLDWWYDDGELFIVKAGNEYACVKQDTYTSCYFISSNDLSYILLNK